MADTATAWPKKKLDTSPPILLAAYVSTKYDFMIYVEFLFYEFL